MPIPRPVPLAGLGQAFLVTLLNFVDNLESSLTTLAARVTEIDKPAGLLAQKLTPGPQGVTLAQLDPAVQTLLGSRLAGTRFTYLWDGTGFFLWNGTAKVGDAATSANSTAAARTAAGYAGTLRDYVSDATGPDPNALGLMIDGDSSTRAA